MRREIKFRAWDKIYKNMLGVDSIEFDGMVGCVSLDGKSHMGCVRCPDDCHAPYRPLKHIILMQYTGLKDKNGREIYEGDIVRECSIGDKIWDGEGIIENCPEGIVEWNIASFNVRQTKVGEVKYTRKTGGSQLHLNKYDGKYQWRNVENLEVIGNIYENPELLEK